MEQGKKIYIEKLVRVLFLLIISMSILWKPPINLNYDINEYDFIIGNLKIFEGLEFLNYLTHRGELITMGLFAILSNFTNYIILLPVIFVYVHYRYLLILYSKIHLKTKNELLVYMVYLFFNTRYLWVISAGRFWISILFFALFLYYRFEKTNELNSKLKKYFFLVISVGVHNSAILWVLLIVFSNIITKIRENKDNIIQFINKRKIYIFMFIIVFLMLILYFIKIEVLYQKANFYLSSRVIINNQFIYRNIELLFFVHLVFKSLRLRTNIRNGLDAFDFFIFLLLFSTIFFIPFYDLNLRLIEASRLFLLVYFCYLNSEYKITVLNTKDKYILLLFSVFGAVIQWRTLVIDIFPFM